MNGADSDFGDAGLDDVVQQIRRIIIEELHARRARDGTLFSVNDALSTIVRAVRLSSNTEWRRPETHSPVTFRERSNYDALQLQADVDAVAGAANEGEGSDVEPRTAQGWGGSQPDAQSEGDSPTTAVASQTIQTVNDHIHNSDAVALLETMPFVRFLDKDVRGIEKEFVRALLRVHADLIANALRIAAGQRNNAARENGQREQENAAAKKLERSWLKEKHEISRLACDIRSLRFDAEVGHVRTQ